MPDIDGAGTAVVASRGRGKIGKIIAGVVALSLVPLFALMIGVLALFGAIFGGVADEEAQDWEPVCDVTRFADREEAFIVWMRSTPFTIFEPTRPASKVETIALLANLRHHNVVLDPAHIRADGAIGIGGWMGERAEELRAFADRSGREWDNFALQVEWLGRELEGPVGAALVGAGIEQTVLEGAVVMVREHVLGITTTDDEHALVDFARTLEHRVLYLAGEDFVPTPGAGGIECPATATGNLSQFPQNRDWNISGLGPLRPETIELTSVILAKWPEARATSGWRPRNAFSHHSTGYAMDIGAVGMVASGRNGIGREINDWLIQMARDGYISLCNTIWWEGFYSARNNFEHRFYDCRTMGSRRCTVSTRHWDHVHISLNTAAGVCPNPNRDALTR